MKATNEDLIRELIENWARAVREKDYDAVLAHHSNDMVMYDVPEPFQSVGIEAYKKTWDTYFSGTEQGTFDIIKLQVIADDNVAFCYAEMRCMDCHANDVCEPLDFRLTVGLKKIDGQWTILHEHHSVPSK